MLHTFTPNEWDRYFTKKQATNSAPSPFFYTEILSKITPDVALDVRLWNWSGIRLSRK